LEPMRDAPAAEGFVRVALAGFLPAPAGFKMALTKSSAARPSRSFRAKTISVR